MRIVFTGGGTGGHIYPGLTLWRYIQEAHPEAECLYIGTERGLERDIVTRAGLAFRAVEAAGLKRQLSLSAVKTMSVTYRGYRQAKRILKDFRPDVVVGTGGYVTLPVVYAASKRNIPSVIWEANARPGLTNQLCARRASAVAISFEDSRKWFPKARRVVLTGNPRASEVLYVTQDMQREAQGAYHIRADRKVILCFAGSRGAETVNQVMLKVLPKFQERPDWQLIYATGDAHYEEIKRQVKALPDNVTVLPFIHDMPSLLPNVDVLVARAGGATLAEICALGLASILIPSPYVTANHQEENAKRLVEHGAARMVVEKSLTPDRLWSELESILDGGTDLEIRKAAKELATPDAVKDLYQLVVDAYHEKQSARKR